MRTGDDDGSWVGMIGLHPDVTALVLTTPGQAPRQIPTIAVPRDPHGPRYAVFIIPENDVDYRLQLRGGDGGLIAQLLESVPRP